jgi:hypothetical protein
MGQTGFLQKDAQHLGEVTAALEDMAPLGHHGELLLAA